ncbi:MAG: hypothetical protein AABX65_00180 [Nanoarchaeota archaeon]
MNAKEALSELRKAEKRNFEQSIDLIINLKGLDLRKDNVSAIINLPYPSKKKKVCGFLTKKSSLVHSIMQPDFVKYRDKDMLKKLVKEFDFFIGAASLMPSVASTFGKVLGPSGKMPSPQLGIVTKEDDDTIQQTLDKIASALKIRLKEPSLKVSIGKENMADEQFIKNAQAVFNAMVQV